MLSYVLICFFDFSSFINLLIRTLLIMCGGKWCNVQVYLCLDYFWGHHPLLVLHVTQFVLLNQDISSVLITIVWCYLCFSLLSTYQHIVYDIWFLIFRKKIFPKEITISISSVNSLVFFFLPVYQCFQIRIVDPWKYTFPFRYPWNDLKWFDHRRHDYIIRFLDVDFVDIWGYHFAL